MSRYRFYRHLLWGLVLSLTLVGCFADEVGGVYVITEPTDTLMAVANQKTNIIFNASGEWTAQTTDQWLGLKPSTGKGGKNIVTVSTTAANLTKQLRRGEVIITSDGKSQTVEILQRDDYAQFDSLEYVVEEAGGEVNIGFETNVERGRLYLGYTKFEWYAFKDSVESTRSESWDGKVETVIVTPNNIGTARAALFMLGIYDKHKNFVALDSTWIRQKGTLH